MVEQICGERRRLIRSYDRHRDRRDPQDEIGKIPQSPPQPRHRIEQNAQGRERDQRRRGDQPQRIGDLPRAVRPVHHQPAEEPARQRQRAERAEQHRGIGGEAPEQHRDARRGGHLLHLPGLAAIGIGAEVDIADRQQQRRHHDAQPHAEHRRCQHRQLIGDRDRHAPAALVRDHEARAHRRDQQQQPKPPAAPIAREAGDERGAQHRPRLPRRRSRTRHHCGATRP
jgi:hypothetical protein